MSSNGGNNRGAADLVNNVDVILHQSLIELQNRVFEQVNRYALKMSEQQADILSRENALMDMAWKHDNERRRWMNEINVLKDQIKEQKEIIDNQEKIIGIQEQIINKK